MYWQVIQFGYPQFLAIMRNGKPFVIRKNGLHEQWYSVTHLRYDIAKLLFTDTDGRDYNYLECDVELYELIVVFTFGFKCRKVWFDGRLCWRLPSDAKEFPKYLAFHLRYNQMYLMFSKLRMERLDLENPQAGAVVERPVSLKRRVQKDKKTVKKAKKVCNRKLTTPKTSIEPSVEEVDGGSTSLNIPRQTEPLRIESTQLQSQNCSTPQEMPLESSNLLSERVRIDIFGKNDRDILRLFQENWHKIILCNGYNSTSNGNIYRYKLDKKFLSKRFRRNCVRKLIESIDFYREEKIIVLGTLIKFSLYKLENNEWTKKEYDIPPIKLCRRGYSRIFDTLSRDQYSVELTMVGGIKLVFRVKEGVKCVEVKFGSRPVWKNNYKTTNFIRTLVYNLRDNSMLVESNRFVKCTKVNNKWINESQIPFYLKHYAEDLGGLIPVYIHNVTQITNRQKFVLDYQNVNFDLIKYREKIIWRRQPGQSIPQSVKCYLGYAIRLHFRFQRKFTYYVLKGDELTEEHYPIPPIRLLNENGMGNIVTLSSEDYSVQLSVRGDVKIVYTLTNGVCTLVKYGKRVIWNCITGEKPLNVFYTIGSGRIEIIFEDKILFTDSKNPNSIVQTIEIPPELTLHKRNERGETVQLSPLEYRVQTCSESGLRYTPSNDVICTELRHNGTVVWSHTEGDHKPLSFNYYFKQMKIISVTFHSKPSIQYELQQDQWTLTNS
ncbi:hypothetical protein TpMuguga_03g00660 [Theileria parva strain Muguga]|uniref:Uncharacterized protein n=1 Tax=Theileria parva TaxID=5875 RepID=Q4MZ31_THEPA|nr:uncharacterized protein TpMuguga_03g00660 [Theileria parva strain Muguga]EAN30501.1 hypothetical protein TpMuguga_03g00660 [Theileria parva strain Muguga]|eukprot:XP_762784.1 hypothetical protein [Theileria parva strain Muguga]